MNNTVEFIEKDVTRKRMTCEDIIKLINIPDGSDGSSTEIEEFRGISPLPENILLIFMEKSKSTIAR